MNYGMDYQGGGGFGADASSSSGFGGGGGGYSSQPPSSGGRARRSYDEQSVIPVTIRMILAARPPPDGGAAGDFSEGNNNPNTFQLQDGRKLLSRIQLVGATRTVEESSTSVVYTVEDGTGLIEVKQWFDENSCSALMAVRQPTLQENNYLKIVGTVKVYDNKIMVLADSVRVLSTSNELTHHLLEVVYSAEKARRKTTFVPGASSMMMSGVGFGATATTPAAARGRAGVPLQATALNQNIHVGGGGGSLTDIVATFIRKHGDHSERGANIQDCIAELMRTGRYTEGEIRKSIEDLSSEGHIYSTIDDNFYKYAS